MVSPRCERACAPPDENDAGSAWGTCDRGTCDHLNANYKIRKREKELPRSPQQFIFIRSLQRQHTVVRSSERKIRLLKIGKFFF